MRAGPSSSGPPPGSTESETQRTYRSPGGAAYPNGGAPQEFREERGCGDRTDHARCHRHRHTPRTAHQGSVDGLGDRCSAFTPLPPSSMRRCPASAADAAYEVGVRLSEPAAAAGNNPFIRTTTASASTLSSATRSLSTRRRSSWSNSISFVVATRGVGSDEESVSTARASTNPGR